MLRVTALGLLSAWTLLLLTFPHGAARRPGATVFAAKFGKRYCLTLSYVLAWPCKQP